MYYAEQLDEFDRGFDFDVEVKALHQLIEGHWGDEAMAQKVVDRIWVIKRLAVKAYVELHTNLLSVTLDNQRAALAVLRGWLRHETQEASVANRILWSYKDLVQYLFKNKTHDQYLLDDLLQKEIKALEKSLETNAGDSIATDLEQQALEYLKELASP